MKTRMDKYRPLYVVNESKLIKLSSWVGRDDIDPNSISYGSFSKEPMNYSDLIDVNKFGVVGMETTIRYKGKTLFTLSENEPTSIDCLISISPNNLVEVTSKNGNKYYMAKTMLVHNNVFIVINKEITRITEEPIMGYGLDSSIKVWLDSYISNSLLQQRKDEQN